MINAPVGTISVTINGSQFEFDDPIVTGREIREKANLVPASAYLLIIVDDRASESVGLDRKVDLRKYSSAEFRSTRGDRIFSFTLNEKGFEWDEAEISEDTLRHIGKIAESEEIVFDSKGDRVLKPNEKVRLSRNGVERFLSRKITRIETTIIINGREKVVTARRLSFEQLIQLAFPQPPSGENICFTASYRNGPRQNPDGSFYEQESVRITDGMIFNVRFTDKS